MKLNEEKLNEMPFVDYLKWMKENASHLSYSKGSSSAYTEAREIIRNLIKRYCKEFSFTSDNYHDNEIGRMLFSTNIELDDYTKYDKTDKMKASTISEFKSDIEDCTDRLISDVKNN